MTSCEVCGNDYDKAIEITKAGETHTFDSFECAIHALAPECAHCGCRIIGHGVEGDGAIFCCAHCAAARGVDGVADRAG
jgi:nitrite reductase/ring-hydroxylating ferredoxin subunit